MSDGLERATSRRNIFERLVSKIPGLKSYIERETRRDVDKMQRDWLAGQVDRSRQAVQGKIRDWTRAGDLAILSDAASLEKLLDRFANRIRHADYGYTGFFDAVKIREDELDILYEFDLRLTETVEALAEQIDRLPDRSAAAELRVVLEATEKADRAFDERATIFEDVTQKGA
jgi:hypothetical protein